MFPSLSVLQELSFSPSTQSGTSVSIASGSCSPLTPFDFSKYDSESPSPQSNRPTTDAARSLKTSSKAIAHPYVRLAKKDSVKRRKIWNHALEKALFTPAELSSMSAPKRRAIYIASLEAHVDAIHNQLLGVGFYPVFFERLEPFKGLNAKTAKGMVAGLQHDASVARLKLLELERANNSLRNTLSSSKQTLAKL